jgi:hypothetical protein
MIPACAFASVLVEMHEGQRCPAQAASLREDRGARIHYANRAAWLTENKPPLIIRQEAQAIITTICLLAFTSSASLAACGPAR